MPAHTRPAVAGMLCLAFAIFRFGSAQAADWLPISSEELQMTRDPNAPGAPAVILYLQVDRSDRDYQETSYLRIKVLTEEGRKWADAEIPFAKGVESIRNIRARVVRPDGSATEFNGQIFEKPISSSRDAKILAKTFTLPDVQVGSILEYRFQRSLPWGYVFDSHWILSQDLFTRHAKFTLQSNENFGLRWSWPHGLPPGTQDPKRDGNLIHLETFNVPAFVKEEYMPPEDELKFRVDFIYLDAFDTEQDVVKFWKKQGKQEFKVVERFADAHRSMEKAVAQIVVPSDPPDAKLRKLYTRVQQLRNISYEPQKTEQEIKREGLDDLSDVGDVWKEGRGNATQLTWLFMALARAAGFQADAVLIPTRDRIFFDPRMMNPRQLNSNVVMVNLDGKNVFLEPGVPYTPFGILPWYETQVDGLRLTKDGGVWVVTPLPVATESRIERTASFDLKSNSLQGKVTVRYTGLEAARRRLIERNEDDADRRQYLEDQLKAAIPVGSDVTLTNSPDWKAADDPLVAEFDVRVPGWGTPAGRRILLASGLFSNSVKHIFEHAIRVQPMYFETPVQQVDDVTIKLPDSWHADSIPKPASIDLKGVVFESSTEAQGPLLHSRRRLTMNVTIVPLKSYDSMQRFFQIVRSADDDQIVLAPIPATTTRN
jgi:hypothetical protein